MKLKHWILLAIGICMLIAPFVLYLTLGLVWTGILIPFAGIPLACALVGSSEFPE